MAIRNARIISFITRKFIEFRLTYPYHVLEQVRLNFASIVPVIIHMDLET